MTILDEIRDYKLQDIAARKAARPIGDVEADARGASPVRPFADALQRATTAGGYGLIAEIKKASPSKGLIRADFDPLTLAASYARAGAACLSVLTDGPSFQGDDAYLVAARAACELPVLRKDFLYDPWQVAESRALGADCILIIMASVTDQQANELEAAAGTWGMGVLVEVHDEAELERASRLKSPLLGINNRDLRTFEVNLDTTRRLARGAPADRIIVSESGFSTRQDLAQMARFGIRCFLIGETLMRQPDVEGATRELLGALDPAGGLMSAEERLTDFDAAGAAHMVDVAGKPETARVAVARGLVTMEPATLARVAAGTAAKGDVLGVARLAGIMAAKRTADLVPLCHPLALTSVAVDLAAGPAGVEIEARVGTTGRTGVEMEALTAVSVAALTVYDMLKSIDRHMVIGEIRVTLKDGGASGRREAP